MAVLDAHELNVHFGQHHAVRDVSLSVDAGVIVGLIGPNGAGKTTIFNSLSGVQRCEGTVHLDGVDVSAAPPHRRARLGMNRTFQRLEIFGSMTARENVLTAAEISARAHRRSLRHAAARTEEVLALIGIEYLADRRADALPTGQARLVELGRALATDPKVVLLDEPASGLDDVETGGLATILTRVAAEGTGILLVEHDMDLVMDLCATLYVLNFGQLIASGSPDTVRDDPHVRQAYLGAMV